MRKKRSKARIIVALFCDPAGNSVPFRVCPHASHELTNHAGARKLPHNAIHRPSRAAHSRLALHRPLARSPAYEFLET